MAGDWIKWTKGFARKPEIVAMSATLGLPRQQVAAAYMELAEWVDAEGLADDEEDVVVTLLSRRERDKSVTDVTPGALQKRDARRDTPCARDVLLARIDEESRLAGFGEALLENGWVKLTDRAIIFRRAARHNTQTAKQRALASKRQQKSRSLSRCERDKSVTDVTLAALQKRDAQRDKSVTREEKRREEVKKKTLTSVRIDPADFQAKWNAVVSFAKIRKMTPQRIRHLEARASDPAWRASWEAALAKIPQSRFLAGHERDWRANVDWFLRPDSVNAILEGKYDGKRTGGHSPGEVHDPNYTSGGDI